MHKGKQEPQKRQLLSRFSNRAGFFVVLFLLSFTLPLSPAPHAQDTENGITLDFEDVEIRSLIRYMAEATGRNFIVDNTLNGKVTIVNPSPLSPGEAFEIFESLLYGAGYAIVPSGSVDRIVPLSEVVKEPLDVLSAGERTNRPSAFVTKNIRLRYVHVNSVLPIVRPLLSKTATLGAFVPGNTLILTESFSNIERIQNVIRQIDTLSSSGAIKLLPLVHADATQVAAILERIFTEEASTTGDKEGAREVQIIAEAATNTLIVVADMAEMRQIEKLVDDLDVDNDEKVKSLEIVYLKNADAPDLAEVINRMLEKSDDEKEDALTDGTEKTALRVLSTFKGPVSVVADESTNALLLSADPEDMVILKDVINRLDIRRLQVYVEALVMEVSSNIADQFGVEWRTASNFSGNSGIVPFGGSTFGNGINALSTNPLNLPTGFSFGLAGSNITFRGQEFANIGLLVRALKSDTNINILSTPQLLTLDNQEAEIIVGDNVPFVTGTFSNDAGGDNPFQTIERKDIGLTLRMTPQISENGFIRMDIYQEFSSVAENRGEATDLVTRKRSIKTAVVVPDQQMIALGGLIRDDVTEANQQIPCLAGMFGVGELFKNTSVTSQKTNLMVFIKPHIINTYGDINAITHSKYTQIREHQKAKRRAGSVLVERVVPDEAAVVPDALRDGNRERFVPSPTRRQTIINPVEVPLRAPEAAPSAPATPEQEPAPELKRPAEPIELRAPEVEPTPIREEAPRTDPFVNAPAPPPTRVETPSDPIALRKPVPVPVAPIPAPEPIAAIPVAPITLAKPPAPIVADDAPAAPTPVTTAPVDPIVSLRKPDVVLRPVAQPPIEEPTPVEVVDAASAPVVAPANPLDTVSLSRPPEDTTIRLQDPSEDTTPLPALDLEKPAEPMPTNLSEPIEDMTLRTMALPQAAPLSPLALAKPPTPEPVTLKAPQVAQPRAPKVADVPELDEVPLKLAAVAMPDTITPEGDIAPEGTLEQPSWSPDDLSFPLPIGYVGFDGDSILMNSYYRDALENIAEKLQGKPRMMLEVRGYAPYDKGTEGRKRALARAVAVRNYLVALGLPGSQIETYPSLSDDADMLRANRVDVLRTR